MDRLSHIDDAGRAKMVDVTDKAAAKRYARACGKVYMKPETLALIQEGEVSKGDVLATARIAGIMAAKKTAELIPLCHSLLLSSVHLAFEFDPANSAVDIVAEAKTSGPTGVEIEALTAVTVAALTVYDMCKAVDRGMRISDVRLLRKSGGQSGDYIAEEERP